MMKGFGLDHESIMSNLTSTLSAETSISSTTRNDQSPSSFASPNHAHLPPPSSKKKRSLPGNPDPEAEVIALSPKSLLATNRFICEICNKGFQRDQNLQLHRRGHNLPWKLKQRPKGEVVRKKVYVCPEPGCPHHEPARALGDLTGIKKHFCRKHGEKKWKCDKCSKKYAVQSDWKAHYKICGTKEYRCDCGTLFSRRDSFITHRAFCDALAAAEDQSGILSSNVHVSFPPWLSPPPPQHPTHVYVAPPPMSATALLQKAAEMGVNLMSTTTTSTSAGGMCSSRDLHDIMLMSSLPSTSAGSDMNFKNQFNQKLNEIDRQLLYEQNGNEGVVMMMSAGGNRPPPTTFSGGGVDEPNTRDFLGLRGLTQNDLINMASGQFRAQINPSNSFDNHNFFGHDHQNQNQNQHQNQTHW